MLHLSVLLQTESYIFALKDEIADTWSRLYVEHTTRMAKNLTALYGHIYPCVPDQDNPSQLKRMTKGMTKTVQDSVGSSRTYTRYTEEYPVKKGQIIGYVGTYPKGGIHLHFSIYYNNNSRLALNSQSQAINGWGDILSGTLDSNGWKCPINSTIKNVYYSGWLNQNNPAGSNSNSTYYTVAFNSNGGFARGTPANPDTNLNIFQNIGNFLKTIWGAYEDF